MTFRLLVWLKTRLVLRSFSRRSSVLGFLSLAVMGLAFAPFWLGGAVSAYAAVRRHGAPALITIFALAQMSWLYLALILGAFSEAFDLRRMLRYPVAPRTVYWLNVLATPVDVVALLMMPPLVAVVLAAAERGAGPAAATAAAVLLFILVTAAFLQLLLALLADLLKHEWSRAAGGLLLGAAIIAVSMTVQSSSGANAPATGGPSALDAFVIHVAPVALWLPTASLPAQVAGAAFDHAWGGALLAALGAGALAWVLVRVGARFAQSAALDRETRGTAPGTVAPAEAPPRWTRALASLLPPDLAVLVERELRYFLRTPQIIIGLVTTPLALAFFFGVPNRAFPHSVYFAAFFTLMPALNLSANAFGLDREGVRTTFILPVAPSRVLLAKNLTIVLVIVLEVIAGALILALVGARPPAADAITAVLGVFAMLPALLAVGNRLSVRSPWRMTFKVGGAPQGAITSAFAQMAVMGVMALFIAAPIVVGRFVLDGGPALPILGVVIEGVAAWLMWALALDGAGEALWRRRELIIDALARAEETG